MDTSAASSVTETHAGEVLFEAGYLLPDHIDCLRYSWEPFLYRLRKHLLRRAPSVAEAASQIIEVRPAEQGERSKALYLQNQLERVIRVQKEPNYEHEKTRIRAGDVEHVATKAYQLRDAALLDGVVFANGTRIPCVLARGKLARYRIETTLSAAAISSSVVGNRYFGHYIVDDACTALLARGYAPSCFAASDAPCSAHQERSLNIYGIPFQEARTCHFEELWVFDDFAMNHHKQARLQQVREKARALPSSRSGHYSEEP